MRLISHLMTSNPPPLISPIHPPTLLSPPLLSHEERSGTGASKGPPLFTSQVVSGARGVRSCPVASRSRLAYAQLDEELRLAHPQCLSGLVKIGWLTLTEVSRHFSPIEFAMLRGYNDLPDDKRYPFVVFPKNRCRPRRIECKCVARPTSPFTGTIILTVCFSTITRRASLTTRSTRNLLA
jgi:hypothetical protein